MSTYIVSPNILFEEKWVQKVKVKSGKMHSILGIPEGEKIQSRYSSGESLAKALVSKVGEKKAAGMLAFAANANSENNIFDAALKHLKKMD